MTSRPRTFSPSPPGLPLYIRPEWFQLSLQHHSQLQLHSARQSPPYSDSPYSPSASIDMAARSRARAACTAVALVLCMLACLSSFALADCGGFAVSCGSIQVSAQGYLTCICGNGSGGYSRASLNLNDHISNANGNLVDGAGFANSCNNIRWYQLGTDNQGVAAECYHTDGSLGSTTLYNVERRVANYGGNLQWNNCRRRSLMQVVEDSSAVASRKMLKM